MVLAPAYGFHRDELYFLVIGRHPAFGYPDQPPLTPLLAAGAAAVLGTEPWAIRILPAAMVAACVVLVAATARELGGSPRAQVVAAVVLGVSGYLAAGHLASTATLDLLAWAAILFLVTRLLRGADPRTWWLVGLVAGFGLQNKFLVVVLGAGLAIALLIHRRDLLRTRGPWVAVGIAVVLWLPNLAWQAANGLPQLEMARRISSEAAANRVTLVPELLFLGGPLLFPVLLAGLWRLERHPTMRPFRVLGTTFLAVVALALVTGGKSYYPAGAWAPVMAAAAIAVDAWVGERRGRQAAIAAVTAGSLAVIALLTLPVLPAATLARTAIPDAYAESAEQVGWPELAATVEHVVASLPPEARGRTVVVTGNYGEAGALVVLGRNLPPVFSGHNGLGDLGPPPDDLTTVVLVGFRDVGSWAPGLSGCRVAAVIGNAVDMPNEENGLPVTVCRMIGSWSELWARYRHLD
jgi:hypothetical protein